MAKSWYISVGGVRSGPHEPNALRNLVASGRLGPSDLVWSEGMTEWVAASKIKGLFGSSVPPPLPKHPPLPPLSPVPMSPVVGRGEPVAAQIPASASTDPAITGVCPKCGGRAWSGHVGCLLVLGMVLLFPIGLLLLLLPRKWKCLACGYSYTSTNKPYGFQGSSLNL